MAALTPVSSVEALISAIEKSGLITGNSMGKVREFAGKADDPKMLARVLVKDGTLTRWQAEQLINGYHRLVVGKYKLLDQLGTVPTGRLYLAEHLQFGRRHTLKVLAKRLASNPGAVKQFLASAQNACSLDHRNISHVYDVSQDKIGHFVVMEHVEGQDLEQLVERAGRVSATQALEFMGQAAEGLAHAHAKGVVHGDLKPSNLLRDHSGTIKILEIGQAGTGARPEVEGADESVETAALAAVIFQAPELRGDGEAADVACDVYSIGSVLCFLLTGKAAKDAASAVKLLEAIVEIPTEAIALCRRLMAVESGERPGSMEEVLAAIGVVARQLNAAANPKNATSGQSDSAIQKKEKWKQTGQSLPKAVQLPAADAITENLSPPIVATSLSQAAPAVEPPPPFQIKTRGRIGKVPGGKAAKASSDSADNASSKSPSNSAFTPLVMAGAIGGGGMLVLALGVALVCVLVFGRSEIPKAEANKSAAVVEAQNSEAAKVAEAAESNPEAVTPEVNPADAAAVVEGVKVAEGTAPEGTAAATSEKTPEPMAVADAVKETPDRSVPKEVPPIELNANPFAGFANAVSLPALPDAAGGAATLAISPVALGPCKVAEKTTLAVALLGGDTAIRGTTRQKFELQSKEGSPFEWEIVLAGSGPPISVAALGVSDGELMFRWTVEGIKQAALSKQLCNCALALGKNRQIVALREAAFGAPLVVEIEKPGAAVKWNVGNLPVAKYVFIEVKRTDGFDLWRQDPQGPVSAGEAVVVGSGPDEKSIPLLFRLKTVSTANTIDVELFPTIKLEGWLEPRNYRRKELVALQLQTSQELANLTAELKKSKASRPRTDPEKAAKEAKIKRLANEQVSKNTLLDQIRFVIDFTSTTKGEGKIHFRVYSLAGDEKIDLLKTEDETPAEDSR